MGCCSAQVQVLECIARLLSTCNCSVQVSAFTVGAVADLGMHWIGLHGDEQAGHLGLMHIVTHACADCVQNESCYTQLCVTSSTEHNLLDSARV